MYNSLKKSSLAGDLGDANSMQKQEEYYLIVGGYGSPCAVPHEAFHKTPNSFEMLQKYPGEWRLLC